MEHVHGLVRDQEAPVLFVGGVYELETGRVRLLDR